MFPGKVGPHITFGSKEANKVGDELPSLPGMLTDPKSVNDRFIYA